MKDRIIIVSGLPRSGTSMMMQMLTAGGLSPCVDNERRVDEDNPTGYFEHQKIKDLPQDNSWVKEAKNKVLKVVSPLLKYLPVGLNYKVIFMERNLNEILASQEKMMVRRGEKKKVSDQGMKQQFIDHLEEVKFWLADQPNFDVLYLSYTKTISSPRKNVQEVKDFLNKNLDVEKMTKAIKTRLYRNKF